MLRYEFKFSKLSDIEYLKYDLVNEICRYQISESFFEKALNKSNYIFYIVDNVTGETIAFWMFDLDPENKLVDSGLICASDIGIKGLGSTLLIYGINTLLKNTPIEKIYIYPATKELIKFYEIVGFRLISEEKNKDGSYNMIMESPKIKPLKQYPFMTLSYEEGKLLYDIERLDEFLNYKIDKNEAKAFIKATGTFENARKFLEEAVPFRSSGLEVNIKPIELREIYKKVFNEDVVVTPLNLKIKIKQYYNNLTAFERIEFIREKLKSNK